MGGFEADSAPHENTSDCESQCSETCIQDEFDQDSGCMEGDSEQEYSGGVECESVCSKQLIVDSSMQCDEKEIACARSKSTSDGQDPPSFFTEKGTLYYFYRESYAVTNHVGARGGRPSYAVLSEHISIDYKKRPDLKGVVIVTFDPNAVNPAKILFESKGLRDACTDVEDEYNTGKTINAFATALERKRLAAATKKKNKKAYQAKVMDARKTKQRGFDPTSFQKKTAQEEAAARDKTMRRTAKLQRVREKNREIVSLYEEKLRKREGNFLALEECKS